MYKTLQGKELGPKPSVRLPVTASTKSKEAAVAVNL